MSDPTVDEALGEILVEVEKLATAVDAVNTRVDVLQDNLDAAPDGPWMWSILDPAQTRALFTKLYDWVTWLEDRYLRTTGDDKGRIIADWYRHPIAVELLTALMVAHTAAYRKKAAAPSFLLVEWHERALWPTLDRMRWLGLFPKSVELNDKWDGPDVRPTGRDDDRFQEFLDDVAPPAAPAPDDAPPLEDDDAPPPDDAPPDVDHF